MNRRTFLAASSAFVFPGISFAQDDGFITFRLKEIIKTLPTDGSVIGKAKALSAFFQRARSENPDKKIRVIVPNLMGATYTYPMTVAYISDEIITESGKILKSRNGKYKL